MRDMKIGTVVTTPDGGTAKVIQIHPQGVVPVYKIRFIDGAETRCTADHLWKVWRASNSRQWEIRTTGDLIRLMKETKYNLLIPLTEPVSFDREYELPIKPYTFGALIGDGCLGGDVITITKPDVELFENIRKDGYCLKQYKTGNFHPTPCFALKVFQEERAWLRKQGLLCRSDLKFIPEVYKYASVEDRLQLIRGLFDTDGYADSRGHAVYTSTSRRLAEDVQWIIRSLGGKATITEKENHYTAKGQRFPARNSFNVYVQTKDNADLFTLPRKRKRCSGKKFNGGFSDLKRRIVSIEPDGEEECQCITLDSKDGLFLTRDFIVTHNSHGLLLTPLRYKNVQGFNAMIFRKNFKQIFNPGGLWDTADGIYGQIEGARPRFSRGEWWFYDKDRRFISKVAFSHIDRDEDLHSHQGAQYCCLGFDELCHFSAKQFFYMLSRNRSICGVKPFVRATCNPDADSWVADFIKWWINQDTGYPIPERSGKIRYFVRRDETLYWAGKKETLWEQFNLKTDEERAEPRSVTFIMSSIYDNKALLDVNPQYLANLKALSEVERERLLHGNWKIKPAAGLYFKKVDVGDYLQVIPDDVLWWVRCWDLAATEKDENGDAAYTAGVLMGKRKNGRYIVADVINRQMNADNVRKTIRHTAQQDQARFKLVSIRLPKDPGQAGKAQAESYIKYLSGYPVKAVAETGSKEARAAPMAAQWQAGNFDLVVGDWNEAYLNQLENFPEGKWKDMVDASANAFEELENKSHFNIYSLI